ncbi:hypothetical protein BJX61DRAFT_542980 [Aspergillus egyptiacus]|nr:hypothetical protein BJX61DRAFT_542980 [Aspergillus egyptiacus]
MPIRWTPQLDQLILETHHLSVDTKKVAEAWPADQERPTPRAITERLVKMRQMAKSNAGKQGHFSIGSTGKSGSAASTPRKSATPAPGTSSTSDATSNLNTKRMIKTEPGSSISHTPVKREMDLDEDSEVEIMESPSKKSKPGVAHSHDHFSFPGMGPAGVVNKEQEEMVDVRAGSSLGLEKKDHEVSHGSPKKRATRLRRPSAMSHGMVAYYGSDDEDEPHRRGRYDDGESSSDEYVPDGPVDADYDDEFA